MNQVGKMSGIMFQIKAHGLFASNGKQIFFFFLLLLSFYFIFLVRPQVAVPILRMYQLPLISLVLHFRSTQQKMAHIVAQSDPVQDTTQHYQGRIMPVHFFIYIYRK